MLKGRIIKNISNSYVVKCDELSFTCVPRGKFRKEKIIPLVGDYCMIDEENNYILEILPRENVLKRPSVSNVSVALIVTSLKEPLYSSLLLDKELSSVILHHVTPVICFTKIDLLNDEELKSYSSIRNYYESIGISCFDNQNLDLLIEHLKGKFVVLTGQSGAGKSTLLNKISPTLDLKTNEISSSLNRGKHTTRHTEVFAVKDILFCDTPGFSSLDFYEYTKEEIKQSFIEFNRFSCKFQDCMHLKECDCGVKEAVEEGNISITRYNSYQKMLMECKK